MATIGLNRPVYAPITIGEDGYEQYGAVKSMAKAISADISLETAEATLYADDGVDEMVKEFAGGTISLGVNNLSMEVLKDLLGATKNEKGVLIQNSEDSPQPVAVGFSAKKANGKYRYFWLYRVVFSSPNESLATKADSVSFNTPTIEGTIAARLKPTKDGKHPWKVEITDGEKDADPDVIANWFTSVYDPDASEAV